VTGDLDLLISRSLDGDLPGEEERELQSLLAADPTARARYDAMAALVGRLEALPEPDSPFALATRINSQVEADTKGLTASLHRFGFYFRPATLGVVAAGIVAVVIASAVMSPQRPSTTVAAAKSPVAKAAEAPDDGRVNVFFSETEKEQKAKKDLAPAQAAPAPAGEAPAAPARVDAGSRSNDAKGRVRQEPVLVASAEAPRPKEEVSFAPERDAPALAASAPAPAAADESVAEGATMQKSVAPETTRLRAAAPQAAGAVRGSASLEVVGKTAGALRPAPPVRLDGLVGPFEGTYRLELDGSGRVTDVARLFGGSGSEPSGLPARLKGLSFGPADAARAAGSVDVKVRLP
jgi:hypothetical protein